MFFFNPISNKLLIILVTSGRVPAEHGGGGGAEEPGPDHTGQQTGQPARESGQGG